LIVTSARQRVAVIGAGIAGLACARRLADAGLKVVVFDKGRNIGGRTATRHVARDIQFDHGAQYFTARTKEFISVLENMLRAGAVATWDEASEKPHFVGTPGMTALAKHIGRDLELHQSAEVAAVHQTRKGWTVSLGIEEYKFDWVIVTIPAPQIPHLLPQCSSFAAEFAGVCFAPCLTLMAALETAASRPFVTRADPDDPLAWIAEDSSKPDRGTEACWVAQANPLWSAEHLDSDSEAIAAMMLPMLYDRLGITNAKLRYLTAHRWRYAKVSEPLGRPFIRHTSGTLYAGGDWCLGARIEAAWTSGDSIARDILRST